MANDKDSAIGTLSAETQRPAWGSLPGFVGRPDPEIYRTGTYAVLDLETTNTDFGSALNPANQIVLGVVKIARGNTDRGRFHFDGKGAHILKGLLANVDFLVAHNAKFEIQWLQRIGAWRPMPVYDTMLAEAVWNANRRGALDLDYLARKYKLGAKSPLIATWLANGGNPIDMPPKWLDQYCEQDVLLTEQLMLNQLKRFEGTRLLPVVYTRCLLTPVLADIERNGMALDAAKVRGRFTEYNEKLTLLERIWANFAEVLILIPPSNSVNLCTTGSALQNLWIIKVSPSELRVASEPLGPKPFLRLIPPQMSSDSGSICTEIMELCE